MNAHRESGIPAIGSLPWGTHLCQFYRTKSDLLETLAPYFAAGLARNEMCLWVTSESIDPDEALAEVEKYIPALNGYVTSGQLTVYRHRDWYTADGFDADRTLAKWVAKEREARERGFEGLRLTGDTAWVHSSGWDDFVDYERRVNASFGDFKLLGICTYDLNRCSARDVLDVVENHEFTVARSHGDWKIIETASLRLAKQELARANTELERRVQERTAELELALRERDKFLAMLAHELRNPLAPIRTIAHVVQRAADSNPDLKRASDILDRQVGHMARMVDDLLDVARITEGRVSLKRERLDLCALVSGVAETLRQLFESRRQLLTVTPSSVAVFVEADRVRLTQVFSNLLENAAKYTQNGGAVTVVVEASGDHALVRVKDNGRGIPKEMLRRIFEPFNQVQQGLDRADGGLGLGLSLVKRLVEMHGGTVEASSDGPAQGATFTVKLAIAVAASTARVEQGVERATAARKVLVIDDNADAAESIQLLLQAEGHWVALAHDGPSGVSAAAQMRPDVVLLDLGLPAMSGFEVARALRQLPALRSTRIVALTGYGQPEDRSQSMAAGCDRHLVKPVSLQDLQAALED